MRIDTTKQIGYLKNHFNNEPFKKNSKLEIPKANADSFTFKGKGNFLPITLRRATINDLPVILKLEKLCFPNSPAIYGDNVAYLKRSIRTDLSHMLAISKNGDIVGHLHTQPLYVTGELFQQIENLYEKSPQNSPLNKSIELAREIASLGVKDVWLNSIGVHPRFKGQKVGFQMMREVVNQAVERKAKKIGLLVEVENEAAINLYKKFGFKIQGTKKDIYGTGKHAYWMEVNLANSKTKAKLDKLSNISPNHNSSTSS